MAEPKPGMKDDRSEEKDVKAPNLVERAKEEIEAIIHSSKSPRHKKETHGTSDDIDETTPVEEVKGPNVFERVKEEIEAIVEAVHPKKEAHDSHGHSSSNYLDMDSQSDSYFTNLLNEEVTNLNNPYVANQNPTASILPLQYSTEVESTTKKARRSRNFSVDEDCLLISAWLNTSIDAVCGNDQKSQKYWQRIYDYFHNHKNFTSDRSANSLMHRWSAIQLSVNKFCGYFAQIDERQQSGVSEQDKMFQAKNMFREIQGQAFQFLHCWHELKHHPKWMSQGLKKSNKRKNSSPANSSPATPTSINFEEHELVNDASLHIDRPIDRKASNVQLKKGKEQIQLTSTALFMKDFCNERREMDLKKIELWEKECARKEEKLVLEKQKEEERIMAIDTTGMPPFKVQYYESLQMEIYNKRCKSSSK